MKDKRGEGMKHYIDLHLHLDGSLPLNCIHRLAELGSVALPAKDFPELTPYLVADPNCKDLTEFLDKFQLPIALLQREECLELAVYELLRMISAQGVIYAEIRFAPSSHCREGLTQRQVVAAVVRGLERGLKAFPIQAQLIACCMRGVDLEINMETARVTKEFLGKGVCCMDLAGAEALFPTKDYAELFAYARSLDIPFIIHAGEAAGPESVWTALEFGAKRIGHGIHSVKDPNLVEYLREHKIPLEVCVTSNVQIKEIENVENHPVSALIAAGVPVTLNTDNMTISGTTVAGEFALVQNAFGLTDDQCRQLLLNAADAAFLSDPAKADLRSKLME